eukprot:TRINITY_DN3077_c0_g1_i2.p1 TRINITY_DN3077_c0_g1~~TRINITY_DN3077_c0_g1_i2.p1  ORF type:complete len:497 (+),score=92.45 TRINITY_DN3077_c0_g1_i2:121-1611(+)
MAMLSILLACIGMQGSQSFRSQERPSAQSEVIEHPAHMTKLAAFGKDFDEFVKNAEKNNPLLFGSGLTEINATSSLETVKGAGKGVFSQNTFCPTEWRAQLEKRGTYVGGGAFGKVYVSELTCDGSKVAIKVQKRTADTQKESKVMMGLDHPNVIKAFASAAGPGHGQMSLLMEACSGGDLDGKSHMKDSEIARLFSEMLQGLAYMHKQDLVHSDMKLENVMLSRKCTESGLETCHSKVADLGLTCSLRKYGECAGLAGTPFYMSPGLITMQRRSKPDDLWALGVMLHQMVKGDYPSFLKRAFTSVDQLLYAVRGLSTQGYAYRARDQSAKEQLLAGLLVASSSRRITVEQAAELANRWMQEGRASVEGTPSSAAPACWSRCQVANCDWRKSSCMLDDTGSANCIGSEDVKAADEQEERMIVLTIRRGYSGKLGFNFANSGKVISLEPEGMAARAGLRKGDTILEMQNHPWGRLTRAQKMLILLQYPVVSLGIKRK